MHQNYKFNNTKYGPWRETWPGFRDQNFPEWGNVKGGIPGPEDVSSIGECKKPPSRDLKSSEDFSGKGAGKKQQQGHHAATFIMQQRQQQQSQQQQKHWQEHGCQQ
jgi:hypothetical protein